MAYFPITGLIGYHRLLLGNNFIFLGRLLLFVFALFYQIPNEDSNFLKFVCIFLVATWIYDVIYIQKIYDNTMEQLDKKIDEIITEGMNGNYGKMGRKLLSKGKTKVYIQRMIDTGKSAELFKKFCTNEDEVNYILKVISKRDTDAAISFVTKKINKNFFS